MTTFEPFDGNLIVGNPGMQDIEEAGSAVLQVLMLLQILICHVDSMAQRVHTYISDLGWLQMCLRTLEEEGILMCRNL
jgi:hypothetical protein